MKINSVIKSTIQNGLTFFWFQNKKIKNRKIISISYVIVVCVLLRIDISLIGTLLCVFVTSIVFDVLINFDTVFGLNNQILCTLPFSPRTLIESYVFAAYIKICIVLTFSFALKFAKLSDVLIFVISLAMFFIFSLNIYSMFLFMKKVHVYFIVNLSFGILFFVFDTINKCSCSCVPIVMLCLVFLNAIVYKKFFHCTSFEKIVIKE